jgi:hypothetical protein
MSGKPRIRPVFYREARDGVAGDGTPTTAGTGASYSPSGSTGRGWSPCAWSAAPWRSSSTPRRCSR